MVKILLTNDIIYIVKSLSSNNDIIDVSSSQHMSDGYSSVLLRGYWMRLQGLFLVMIYGLSCMFAVSIMSHTLRLIT